MPIKSEGSFNPSKLKTEIEKHDHALSELPSWMFDGLVVYVDERNFDGTLSLAGRYHNLRMRLASIVAAFAGATIAQDLTDGVTHILTRMDRNRNRVLRKKISRYGPQGISTALATF